LPIELDDTYTIAAWWPAAPAGTNWTAPALYEVVSGGIVVASTNLDQRVNGDQWHTLATVRLTTTNQAYLRLTAPPGPCVADAIYVRSAARYNNGQPADAVRLQPMDGIVLARERPTPIPPRLNGVHRSATHAVLTATDLTPGLTHELQRTPTLTPPGWTVSQSFVATDYTATVTDPATNGTSFYRLCVPVP
jgi:hypothetical protein